MVIGLLRRIGDSVDELHGGLEVGKLKGPLYGEALALPYRLTQPQLDALADMLIAAPESRYRSALLASLRQLREMETRR